MKIIRLTPLSKPVKAEVNIPGSKSYTNRALLIAAMVNTKVKILNPLLSGDTKAMINCLKKLGIKIIEKKKSIEVIGSIKDIKNQNFQLNANESGTTIRFLLALSTIIPGTKVLKGNEGLNKRPISDLVEGLRQLGAKIEYLEKQGCPPVKASSSRLNPGIIKINGSISSQYLSAILMVAPLIGEITIEVTGNQVSKPYIDMTIAVMDKFGVKLRNNNYKLYHVSSGQRYHAKQYVVEGDLSSAGYFLAIAALTKSTITLKNINPDSKQADLKFIEILKNMGNEIVNGKNEITIIGKGIKPINVDMENCPDQIQTLAVLAAFAKGNTKISGISTLKIKETNRVFAIKKEFEKMNIKTSSAKNVLTIYGESPKAAYIETYGDHRMAMSFAVAGTKLSGIKINNPDVVSKTFPDFWKELNSIGIKIHSSSSLRKDNSKNIVLIGMRGSGKTTVAKILSKKLNKQYLELDELIVKKTKLTIPEMVSKYGWGFFRDKESEIVQKISTTNGKVISTGGGIIIKPKNIDALKKNGVFIFLNASLETLVRRIKNNSNRPPLTNKKNIREEIAVILKQRKQQYENAADKIINTDYLNPMEVADKIVLSGIN